MVCMEGLLAEGDRALESASIPPALAGRPSRGCKERRIERGYRTQLWSRRAGSDGGAEVRHALSTLAADQPAARAVFALL
jgi:hypothetical protein